MIPENKGYILLAKTDTGYKSIIENSFSMGVSEERGKVWFTFLATGDNLGLITPENPMKVDGERSALSYKEKCKSWNSCKGLTFEMFEIHDPSLPVTIDWDTHALAENKFDKRNPYFTVNK